MPNVGRNDPCPCGSGKKYKQCHGPIDAERAAAQRKLKQAPDTLWPKLMDALDRFGTEVPATLSKFWNEAYTTRDIQELDQHEDRGSERFLTWFAFDSQDESGQTPVQRLIADPEGMELTEAEAKVFAGWRDVRLQPYEIVEVQKGQGMRVRPLFGETLLYVEDHAAAKRLQVGEVLIMHLVPAADVYFIGGAAAQLTPDTVEKLREFAEVHLQDLRQSQPDATYDDLINTRSYIFNHFVMALPREEQDNAAINELVAKTRATLNVTMGLKGEAEQPSAAGKRSSARTKAAVSVDAETSEDAELASPDGASDSAPTAETDGASTANPAKATANSPRYEGQDD